METITQSITAFSMRTTIAMIVNLLLTFTLLGGLGYLFLLAVKALRKYLRSGEIRKERTAVRKSLGEVLKEHRVRCRMTQEFVAERLGVSRQAVSKWENGTSDPSTSNLLALAKLYDIQVEELLKEVQP